MIYQTSLASNSINTIGLDQYSSGLTGIPIKDATIVKANATVMFCIDINQRPWGISSINVDEVRLVKAALEIEYFINDDDLPEKLLVVFEPTSEWSHDNEVELNGGLITVSELTIDFIKNKITYS